MAVEVKATQQLKSLSRKHLIWRFSMTITKLNAVIRINMSVKIEQSQSPERGSNDSRRSPGMSEACQ